MSPTHRRAPAAGLAALACLLVAAPSAFAASISQSAGTLTYSGADVDNDVSFTRVAANTVQVVRDTANDSDPISAPPGCTENTVGEDYTCAGVDRVVANGNGGDDVLDGSGLTDIPITLNGATGSDDLTAGASADGLNGGDGEDVLNGGGANDVLSGLDGGDFINGGDGEDDLDGGDGDDLMAGDDGNDRVSGEDGDDRFIGGPGNDDISGGRGFDTAYGPPNAPPAGDLRVTLDDIADDLLSGTPGEVDNVHTDIEGVEAELRGTTPAPPSANDTIVGSGGPNTLSGGRGNDTLDGNAGNDVISGGDGDDAIRARDSYADFIICGAGVDAVQVDTLDRVAECENVDVVEVGNALDVPEDLPPALTLDQPAAGALLPTTGPTTMTATATDDRGIAQVLFIDDDRIVCADAEAPYTCAYSPRGEDVGRNTLVATAIDTAQQTASVTRAVRVDRFTPTLTASVTPRRDRRAPFRFRTRGRLRLPAAVQTALGCAEGVVSVQVKSIGKTISTRRAELRGDCSFSSTVKFATRRRFSRNGRLRFEVRFAGNEVLKRSAAFRRNIRTRR
jgi:hypothetical protein